MPSSYESESASKKTKKSLTYYEVLGVSSSATQDQIRDAYRRKSKLYHPDTTSIEKTVAAQKFQTVSQAYDTLRFPEKREAYDVRLKRLQSAIKQAQLSKSISTPKTNSAFLEPEDRALSAGEIFALFILGVTFLFCLLIALFLGISRGEMLVNTIPEDSTLLEQVQALHPKDNTKTKSSTLKSGKQEGKQQSHSVSKNAGSHSTLSQQTPSNPHHDDKLSPHKKQVSLFPNLESK